MDADHKTDCRGQVHPVAALANRTVLIQNGDRVISPLGSYLAARVDESLNTDKALALTHNRDLAWKWARTLTDQKAIGELQRFGDISADGRLWTLNDAKMVEYLKEQEAISKPETQGHDERC